MRCDTKKRLKVAVIGAGPSGLGAAIELARLPFIDWDIYEKKAERSETGGGISLQAYTWRLLQYNGAFKHIGANDFYRPADRQVEQRRYVIRLKYNSRHIH